MINAFPRRFDDVIARQLRTVANDIEHNGMVLGAYVDPDNTSDKPFRLKASQEKFTRDAGAAINWHLRELWNEDPSKSPSDALLRSRRDLSQILHKHPQISGFAMQYVLAIEDAVVNRIAEMKQEPAVQPPRHSERSPGLSAWLR